MTEKPEQGGMLLPDEAAPMLEAAVMGDEEALQVATGAWDKAYPPKRNWLWRFFSCFVGWRWSDE